jgi:hypothetical protein
LKDLLSNDFRTLRAYTSRSSVLWPVRGVGWNMVGILGMIGVVAASRHDHDPHHLGHVQVGDVAEHAQETEIAPHTADNAFVLCGFDALDVFFEHPLEVIRIHKPN